MTAARPPQLSLAQQEELLEDLAGLSSDPLAFVLWAFPWGEPETELATFTGPSPWQREVLEHVRDNILTVDEAIQVAIASGHDIGKSALVAWLLLWAIGTWEDTRGVVTAGTGTQLKTKTWPELAKWHSLWLAKSLFTLTATSLHSVDASHEHTWRIDQVPWNKDRPEAFSGLHNMGKRIIMIFDEASQIHDSIWEATDGVLLDKNTQIMLFAFGNPTRKNGRFFECFNKQAKYWWTRQIDSRTVPIANHKQINQWKELWGETSDYFKVRVLGQFPSATSIQFLPSDIVQAARNAEAACMPSDPLIIGVDVARYGNNESVIVRRKGRDARTWPVVRLRNYSTTELARAVVSMIAEENPGATFVDEGGVGGGVVDQIRELRHTCIGINFGSKPSSMPQGTRVANKRAEMYELLRQWLSTGGAIEDNDELEDQLTNMEYSLDRNQAILLESKDDMRARGVESPDWADALALTFALPVASGFGIFGRRNPQHQFSYDPFQFALDEMKPTEMRVQ